ncbi:hypothetical protein SteCoe_14818 [Stentor coeruleus]|uniref:Uncharacterized protein n=1 Tax=Stentor coeruleus TaxID=5963 RepID=A0A1R2C559_9CILI|nr:hypothetical protein SteCoe_14818 [Stentor coeruleus]
MGCDFSQEVKQEFNNKVSEIEGIKKRISQKEFMVKDLISDFNSISLPEIETESLSRKLDSTLVRLEKIAEEVRKMKQCKTDETVNINDPIIEVNEKKESSFRMKEKSAEPPQQRIQPKRSKTKLPTKINSPSGNPQTNILRDPKIQALISKNRNLLLRKLTT